ncbi:MULTISPECIES: TIGR00288 family NYN domain-containing protein [Thermococcus]|uniref:NYN domain-containing protein n=1 Tax=Thermococcus barossii TaxID=54077 RepID=A0A2Z2MJC3_9EURY|nr:MULTISPECIES: TIGR00288 family NYN domain-containing protein [Thermococcus]ASJ04862.1 NYN domain-containing protein [Thermococcus barossii]NJE76931.1 TIGR00288 family NYN domain-containing protein [Thermococcus sp. ES12]
MKERFFRVLRRGEKEVREVSEEAPKPKKKRSIGLIIDGPNILRKEFGIKLEDIIDALERIGKLRVAKVVLNQYAPQGLIEAVVNQGLEPIIVAGDTDVRIAIEAMELIYNSDVDVIALATRDADFLPIVNEAKRRGKETIVIGVEPGFSVALQNAADYVIKMEGKGGEAHEVK